MNGPSIPEPLSNVPADAGWPETRVEQAVRRHARERPDDVAIVGPSTTLTWRDLDGAGDRAASVILDTVGAQSCVAWLGANDIGYCIVLLASWRTRSAMAGLNWRLPDADIAASCQEVGVTQIFTSAEFADRARTIAGDSIHVEVVDQTTTQPWPEQPLAETLEPAFDDRSLIFFTSGSTGVPKAVPLTRLAVEVGATTPVVHGFTPESRLLIIPPVFHLAGSYWAQYGMLYGARQYYLAVPTPAAIVTAMADDKITHAVFVPALIRAIVDELATNPVDLDAFKHAAYGASPITGALLRAGIDALQSEFCQVYGMTEAGGVVSYLAPEDHVLTGPHSERLKSAGKVIPGVDVEVRDLADGTPLRSGEPGVLFFRTPFMGDHYVNRPDQTAEVFVDGWLNTRDIGYVDEDGFIYVQGRADDMIITGGENVHPLEVEDAIALLPDVVESAVFGVPDDRWGQRVCAAVIARGGALTADSVVGHCREHLAGYKVPKTVLLIDELPRTANGKVVRAKLIEAAQEASTS